MTKSDVYQAFIEGWSAATEAKDSKSFAELINAANEFIAKQPKRKRKYFRKP